MQDERVVRQVVDCIGSTAFGEIGGAGAKPQRNRADLPGDEFGIAERTDPDRKVDVFGWQINRAIFNGQHETHIGIASKKLREHRREGPHREGEADTDPERPRGFADQPSHRVFRFGNVIQDSRGVPTQQDACISQSEMAGRALDQRGTNRLFQSRQRPADR